MAITVIPVVPLTGPEQIDVALLQNLINGLGLVLDRVASIPIDDRTMEAGTLASINHTITDASDRIDAIINPPAPLV